jgi:YnbE-like lipoprotein
VKNAPIRMGLAATALALAGVTACTPKVAVEAPKEPIVINMNVKIDHEIRVKLDKDLDQAMADDKENF